MLTILTGIIGVVARGTVAKAVGGALGGAFATQLGPLANVFAGGAVTGATPAIENLGVLAGQLIIGGAVGYATTWLAPKNKEVPK